MLIKFKVELQKAADCCFLGVLQFCNYANFRNPLYLKTRVQFLIAEVPGWAVKLKTLRSQTETILLPSCSFMAFSRAGRSRTSFAMSCLFCPRAEGLLSSILPPHALSLQLLLRFNVLSENHLSYHFMCLETHLGDCWLMPDLILVLTQTWSPKLKTKLKNTTNNKMHSLMK